mmetsp:Transcript_66564/g.98674  ORF Transcript_66564/g.98674 Transcript_66564/m.98674 type:complete len:95 (-) Transcript_66564:152-436(-)
MHAAQLLITNLSLLAFLPWLERRSLLVISYITLLMISINCKLTRDYHRQIFRIGTEHIIINVKLVFDDVCNLEETICISDGCPTELVYLPAFGG